MSGPSQISEHPHHQQSFGDCRVRLLVVPLPRDLANRIRRARQDRNLTQHDLAAAVGVDVRTVQGWESGRRPRGAPARKLEVTLGLDLDATPESISPRLDEASDAQVIAHLAARLADRESEIRDLRRRLDALQGDADTVIEGRWAARTREDD